MIFNYVKNGFFLSDDSKYALILPSEVMIMFVESRDGVDYYQFSSQPFCRFDGANNIINSVDYRGIVGEFQYILDEINSLVSPGHNNIYYSLKSSYSDAKIIGLVNNPPDVVYDSIYPPHYGFLYNVDEFTTNLYPELLDNKETKLSLQDWIDDNGTPRWDTLTDKDLKAMDLIEKYNKNVLLLRSTRKVQASVSGSISSSSSGGSVNLSGVENKLQNINNNLTSLNDKFEVQEQVDGDVEIKTLTQVVKDLDLSNQTVVTTVESAPYNPLLSEGEDIYNS